MTQQKPGSPLDYGKSTGQETVDRLRDIADTATDKLKDVGASAQEEAD
jgi:hypothetical protein